MCVQCSKNLVELNATIERSELVGLYFGKENGKLLGALYAMAAEGMNECCETKL